jgi:hypothetical protein
MLSARAISRVARLPGALVLRAKWHVGGDKLNTTFHELGEGYVPGPPQVSTDVAAELAHRLNRHGVLDLQQHPKTNEDLSRLGFIAETRGHVRYGPDGGIVETPLMTNRAERSEALRNPDAEANLVPSDATFSIFLPGDCDCPTSIVLEFRNAKQRPNSSHLNHSHAHRIALE